jgi:signal transduction histidine kinase
MILERTNIAVVGALDAGPFERAGATVTALDAAEFWTSREPHYDLVVVGGMDAGRAAAFVRELRSDERTRTMPRVVVTRAEEAARMLRAGGVVLADAQADLVAIAAELLPDRESVGRLAALEEQLRQAVRELEERRKERAALAHDGRVLLAVALGFACNLRDGIAGDLDESQRGAAMRIAAAVQEAAALLERTPSTSEAPRSGGPVKRMPKRAFVRLDTLVSEAATLFEEMATERGIALEHGASDETGFSLWCDPVGVKQIVVNLIVNALKFTPRGGRVRVLTLRTASSIAPGIESRAGARIIVADSGPGIANADRERIFERGTRLERDAALPGHGIGLAIVKEIALAHRGTVEVGPSAFGGTAFEVKLPLDLRRREGPGVILAAESPEARELARILGGSSIEALSAASDEFLRAATAARALVLLPRGSEETLSELLRHLTRS